MSPTKVRAASRNAHRVHASAIAVRRRKHAMPTSERGPEFTFPRTDVVCYGFRRCSHPGHAPHACTLHVQPEDPKTPARAPARGRRARRGSAAGSPPVATQLIPRGPLSVHVVLHVL